MSDSKALYEVSVERRLNKVEVDKLDLVLEKLDKLIELMTPSVLEPKDNRRMVIGRGKDGKKIEGRINADEKGMWVSIEWDNGKISPIEDFEFFSK